MQTVNDILNIFEGFRMPALSIDEYQTAGKPKLAERISSFVEHNQPLKFVMLGYPMKSPNNRDKVIGTRPDLAEEVSLNNFARFHHEIGEVYTPGVQIQIVSDGYIFSDIMEVPDRVVRDYEERSIEMAGVAPIRWYDMTDFYPKGIPMDRLRVKVMEQWGITPEALEQRILMDPDVNSLYRGMIKFLTMDLAIRDFTSNSQLHKQAKIVAREMMFRNEAYSKLIQSEFKDSIRLSMHPSVNNGTKYSFQLIPSPKAWTSPWHCALLVEADGTLATIHRKDAIAAGHELVYENGQPYYFQAV